MLLAAAQAADDIRLSYTGGSYPRAKKLFADIYLDKLIPCFALKKGVILIFNPTK